MEKIKIVAGKAGILLLMAVYFMLGKTTVNAEELEMLYTTQKTEVYEKKDTSSKVLITIEEGIPIMVLEKSDDWCQVQYKDATGYVEASLLQQGNEEVAAELNAQQEYNVTFMSEIFRLEDEKAKSRVWGAVIVLLIIGIFGGGIFNTIKVNKKENEEGIETDKTEEIKEVNKVEETDEPQEKETDTNETSEIE